MRLEGKVAIVTGAASGLGRATAQRFAAEEAKVVIADFDKKGGEETESQIRAAGGEAAFTPTNVCNSADVQRMASFALERYGGRIDILVNGVGVLRLGQVVDLSEEIWDQTMDVNVKGTFLCCKAVLPAMLRQRSGVIVNVSSSAALRPSPDYPAYTAAKFAVEGFTRALAAEVNTQGICVVAVRPGVMDTPLGRQGFIERRGRTPNKEELEHMLQPEEVAGVILNLASPEMARTNSAIVDVIVP